MPGQTRGRRQLVAVQHQPSMEGRAIARPNPTGTRMIMPVDSVLQWRAGQLPGQTRRLAPRLRLAHPAFNGGPGNCPAKPDNGKAVVLKAGNPSMEGRAIARPNTMTRPTFPTARWTLQWRAGQLPGQTVLRSRGQGVRCAPSMEGRAIPRPNYSVANQGRSSLETFNGGPGNCPAKRASPKPQSQTEWNLQWRAGQLPGQTTTIA